MHKRQLFTRTQCFVLTVLWQKGLWAALFLAMFTAMCVHLGMLLQRYLNYETISDVSLVSNKLLKFPGELSESAFQLSFACFLLYCLFL